MAAASAAGAHSAAVAGPQGFDVRLPAVLLEDGCLVAQEVDLQNTRSVEIATQCNSRCKAGNEWQQLQLLGHT